MAVPDFTRISSPNPLTPTDTQREANFRELIALWALGEEIYARQLATLTEAVTTAEKRDHHV